jgi:hypothetical protein
MPTPSEFDPSAIQREIAQLETEAARHEIDRASVATSVARFRRRVRYLQLAQWLRSPGVSFSQFSLVVLAVGPLVCGVAAFVVLSLTFGSWSVASGGFLLATIACAIALAALLFHPSNEIMPAEAAEAEVMLEIDSARLTEIATAVAEMRQRLAVLRDQRREWGKSEKLQRAMLLQRPWKAMRGAEWEDFVVEVCRTLGANVLRGEPPTGQPPSEQVPNQGARGVIRRLPTTLYVTISPKRFAVAAVSDIVPFHAAAVRQIIDYLAIQGCDELAIITNTRLTSGSKEFARSRHCTLIGEEEFPDFVLGTHAL